MCVTRLSKRCLISMEKLLIANGADIFRIDGGGGASVNSSSAVARLAAMDITGLYDARGMGCSGRFMSPRGV